MTGLEHDHENMVPPGALKAAFALVAVSLMLVAAVRVGAVAPPASPAALRAEEGVRQTSSRLLRFADAPRGRILVTDAASGGTVAAIGTENSGFVRGVMRGLARERHLAGKGPAAPFALAQWTDGALTLTDTATGRVIELGSFGPTNRAAFSAFLPRGGGR